MGEEGRGDEAGVSRTAADFNPGRYRNRAPQTVLENGDDDPPRETPHGVAGATRWASLHFWGLVCSCRTAA